MKTGWGVVGVLSLFCLVNVARAQPSAEQVLTDAGLSAGDRQSLMAGQFVNVSAQGVSERDLAFAIAFLVKTPPETLAKQIVAGELVTADEQVKAYGEISGEGSLADFAKLTLTGDEAKALAGAKAGGKLNLSASEIAAFKAIAGGAGQAVQEQLRRMLLARYQAYRASGLAGIAGYDRGGGRTSDPASDLRKASEATKGLQKYLPAFQKVLLDYPKASLPGLQERFYWTKSIIQGDTTYVLNHVLVAADGVGSRVRQQFLPHAQVLDTGTRWLGGKTLLTEQIIRLLPASMHECFAMVFGPQPTMMFGGLWFRTPPNQAAAQFWPGLRFQHPEDFVTWGLIGHQEQFPIPDEDVQAMDSPDLQHLAVELTNDWYPELSPLIKLADPEESFFLTLRQAVPLEPWQTSTITLLGDAIHVMPANGSGANSALRDASQLARSLIAVASQGMPLRQALYSYESEMLRAGFGVVWPSPPGMQSRGSGIPFTLRARRSDS